MEISVLADGISGLIELGDFDLEANPLKVYERMDQQTKEDIGGVPESLPKDITVPRLQVAGML